MEIVSQCAVMVLPTFVVRSRIGTNNPLHTEPRVERYFEINVVFRGPVNVAVITLNQELEHLCESACQLVSESQYYSLLQHHCGRLNHSCLVLLALWLRSRLCHFWHLLNHDHTSIGDSSLLDFLSRLLPPIGRCVLPTRHQVRRLTELPSRSAVDKQFLHPAWLGFFEYPMPNSITMIQFASGLIATHQVRLGLFSAVLTIHHSIFGRIQH